MKTVDRFKIGPKMAKWGHFQKCLFSLFASSQKRPKTTKNDQKRPNQKTFLTVSNLYDLIWRMPLTVSKSDQKWPNEAIFRNDFAHFCSLVTNGPTPFDCILIAFWLHFDWILIEFWLHFDCILTEFCCILTSFWLHFAAF